MSDIFILDQLPFILNPEVELVLEHAAEPNRIQVTKNVLIPTPVIRNQAIEVIHGRAAELNRIQAFIRTQAI